MDAMCQQTGIIQRRTCELVELPRATKRYVSKRKEDTELIKRIKQLADKHKRFGYRRIHVLAMLPGVPMNHKKAYRLYCQMNLQVKPRKKRKKLTGRECIEKDGEF